MYLEGKNIVKEYIRVLVLNVVYLVGFGTCLGSISLSSFLFPSWIAKIYPVLSHCHILEIDNLFAFTHSELECSLAQNKSHLGVS